MIDNNLMDVMQTLTSSMTPGLYPNIISLGTDGVGINKFEVTDLQAPDAPSVPAVRAAELRQKEVRSEESR